MTKDKGYRAENRECKAGGSEIFRPPRCGAPAPSPVPRNRSSVLRPGSLVLMSLLILGGYYGAATATGNFHEVVPHRIYRSGQPSAGQLRAWIRRYNLKTIIILRGRDARQAAEEDAVARSMGADVVTLKLSAYVPLPGDKLVQLIDILESARQPMLLHCRHGVDRAGTASAIAAWLVGGQTYGFAKWQAYMPPGPWKDRKGTGHISDVLTFYERYCREQGRSPDDPSFFKYWATNVYQSRQSPAGADDGIGE